MKAITFDVTVPRYLLGKSLGGLTSSVTFGALSGVRMRDIPEPPIPGPDWVRLQVLSAGICGTDISTLTFSASPALEPFASFPAVLGHEILARVVEVGPKVTRVQPGQRVAVEPEVSCTVRGHSPKEACSCCRDGWPSACEKAGETGPLRIGGSPLGPGLTIGYHRDLPGGWGEGMVAHESQLYSIPDEMGDKTAILVEPLAIALHAVLRAPPTEDEPVMVVGSGPIAMGVIWAIRAIGFRGTVVAQAKRPAEVAMARALGATDVVRPGEEARQAVLDTGAQAYQPLVGPEVYAGGGFPLIYDCVGSKGSLEQALRFASPRGQLVLLGCAAQIRKLDLTFLWARELEVVGVLGYGDEAWEGRVRHTFDVTQELMLNSGSALDQMVTHVFPLSQYKDALKAASNRGRSGAMKVVLKPGA